MLVTKIQPRIVINVRGKLRVKPYEPTMHNSDTVGSRTLSHTALDHIVETAAFLAIRNRV